MLAFRFSPTLDFLSTSALATLHCANVASWDATETDSTSFNWKEISKVEASPVFAPPVELAIKYVRSVIFESNWRVVMVEFP